MLGGAQHQIQFAPGSNAPPTLGARGTGRFCLTRPASFPSHLLERPSNVFPSKPRQRLAAISHAQARRPATPSASDVLSASDGGVNSTRPAVVTLFQPSITALLHQGAA